MDWNYPISKRNPVMIKKILLYFDQKNILDCCQVTIDDYDVFKTKMHPVYEIDNKYTLDLNSIKVSPDADVYISLKFIRPIKEICMDIHLVLIFKK